MSLMQTQMQGTTGSEKKKYKDFERRKQEPNPKQEKKGIYCECVNQTIGKPIKKLHCLSFRNHWLSLEINLETVSISNFENLIQN